MSVWRTKINKSSNTCMHIRIRIKTYLPACLPTYLVEALVDGAVAVAAHAAAVGHVVLPLPLDGRLVHRSYERPLPALEPLRPLALVAVAVRVVVAALPVEQVPLELADVPFVERKERKAREPWPWRI